MQDTSTRSAKDTLDKVFEKLSTGQAAEISGIPRLVLDTRAERVVHDGIGDCRGKRIQGINFSVDYVVGELRFRDRVVDFTCSASNGPVLLTYEVAPRFADAQRSWLAEPDAALNNYVFDKIGGETLARAFLPDDLSHPEQIYYFFLAHMRGE